MTTQPVGPLYEMLRTLPEMAAPADALDRVQQALVTAVDCCSVQELDETGGELVDLAATWWSQGHRAAAEVLWRALAQLDSHRDFIGTYVDQARQRLEALGQPGLPSRRTQQRQRMTQLGPAAVMRDELRTLLSRKYSKKKREALQADIVRRLEALQQITKLTPKELRLLSSLRS